MDDPCFSPDEDAVLLDMARTYNVKHIKNRLELSAIWDSVTEAFNKATGRHFAKKQLQKRLTNISYKQKKQEEKQQRENTSSEPVNSASTLTTSESCNSEQWTLKSFDKKGQSCYDLEQQKIRAEMAKEMAELKRAKAEEVRLKKEQVLLKVALANLKEAEKRAELCTLEVEEKKRKMHLKDDNS